MLNVTMIGTGYVGLVSGTCFAELGHNVHCIDIDPRKIRMLESGKSPIYEPGLSDLLSRNIKSNRLTFSTDYSKVKDSDIVFLAVGTPTSDDGSADLTYIFEAAKMTAREVKENATIVIKSTVPVGTFQKIKDIAKKETSVSFNIVSNPEFLKEGAAIEDFMKPDRIVIGTHEDEGAEVMRDLYRPITDKGFPLIEMSNSSAEMSKYAANCFLATKISFINEIAQLCDRAGADIDEVREGIKTDPRIGKYFLNPGAGYGGSCFPKDVKALIQLAVQHDLDFKIVKSADEVNNSQRYYIADKLLQVCGENLEGKNIALWGLAFKPETDDIREAPSKFIIERLVKHGAKITCYDPVAAENFQAYLEEQNLTDSVKIVENKEVCAQGADALILVTEWKEFSSPDLNDMKSNMNDYLIFDARNLLVEDKIKAAGFRYFGIGRGE